MSHYAVASLDTDFDKRVRQALGATNGDVLRLGPRVLRQGPAAVLAQMTEEHATDVLAVGPTMRLDDALRLARYVDESHPEISVVLVAPEAGPEMLESAMHAGVRDMVPADVDDETLREVLERAARSSARRRANLTGVQNPGRGDRRIIVVLSPKGGAGKTALSTNLAAGMARNAPGKVVLVDLDLAFGDTASALGLAPEHSMLSAVRSLDRLDAMALKVFLTPHRSGLLTLCAPDRPEDAEAITGAESMRVLELLSKEFRDVVVDTPGGLTEHSLAAIERATDLLFVCTMDVGSVRSLHKIVLALDELGHDQQRRHFVLNRAESRVGLDTGDIERTVGMPVSLGVPSHRTIPLSMNQGAPLVLSEERGRSRIKRSLDQLVDRFERAPVPAAGPWSAHNARR